MNLWEDLQFRGLIAQVTDETLAKRLNSESLTVYLGLDPTAPSLHLGNLLGLSLLRRLQMAGHRPIAVAGGGTGMVGDPGGRSEERNLLDAQQLASNLDGIRSQLKRFLDFEDSDGRPGAVMVNNGDWLWDLNLLDFLRDVGKHFSVNQMVAKDSVRTRLENREQGISYTEFSYMLLQAYDFLHLYDTYGCTLQFGGSDQWGNITSGIDLVRRMRGAQVWGLTTPLVVKADGTKFGKSVSGAIWLDRNLTSAYSMYQFLLQSEDSAVGTYLRYFTWLDHEEILRLEQATALEPHKRAAQKALAREVVTWVHGEAEAKAAEAASVAIFGGDLSSLDERTLLEVFEEVPSSARSKVSLVNSEVSIVDVLVECGLASSKAAARRDVSQGAISINGETVMHDTKMLGEGDLLFERYLALRKGKRNWHLISFAN